MIVLIPSTFLQGIEMHLSSGYDRCMAEYLPPLEETLEKQVLEAVSLIDVRRRFIEALAVQFGRPVEADPIFCRKATFLAASGVFTFLVHLTITTQFPKQPPAIVLQSSQARIFSSQPVDYLVSLSNLRYIGSQCCLLQTKG
ncbi:putative brain/reproductive organ-expressed protein [Rosa chinensis]|uniref:BRISC and BRCA1-A complex member 2 n=1 Tax=Rosa chinensis TaxID=74649 RepID=A0A2P6QS73_ROSCH|nr:putative brain/reproductive organ-expressed protein [Rosa chinensis]